MKKILATLISVLPVSSSIAQLGEWTWIKGSDSTLSFAEYGTQGIPSPTNTPEGFYEACEWRDQDGNFWLYGGQHTGSSYSNLWKYQVNTNEWTWVKGPGSIPYELPVYGTQGLPDIGNTPGARDRGIATWTDIAGNLWLFGGLRLAQFDMADLWKYDISTNEWTWIKGSDLSNQPGVYGTQGIPDSLNSPGGRHETNATWTDDENNLWLFGGYGYDANGTLGLLNDLWKYNPATNEWTWMRGSPLAEDPGNYGIKGVADTSNNPPARMIFTKWKDVYGNFWIYGGGTYIEESYYNDVWKFEPATNQWTWMSGTNQVNHPGNTGNTCNEDVNFIGPARFENRACWVDQCGGFWSFGGGTGIHLDQDYNDLWFFNPQSLEWSLIEGSLNTNPVGDYGIQGVSSPSNQPPGRAGGLGWIDTAGNLWMWGGTRSNSYMNDLWRYVIDANCPGANLCMFPPESNLSVGDNSICDSGCVKFFDETYYAPTSWSWSFPGAIPSSSTAKNPANICYSSPGSYDVMLVTTNAFGTDTVFFPGYIQVYTSPAPPVLSQSNDTVFSSAAYAYQWSLDSVIIPGETNQFIVITQSGEYSVEITDSTGCTAAGVFFALLPISGFVVTDSVGCPGDCFDFINTSVDATSYEWLFPGGSPSSSVLQHPTGICYAVDGTYDVTLIASNQFATDTIVLTNYITINPSPQPPVIVQSNDTLTSSVADSYQWYFSGNVIVGATNQELIITQDGEYSVLITDSNGCSSSDTILAILLIPESIFSSALSSGCPGTCIDFTNSSINALNYEWLFPGGNPSSSSLQDPGSICYSSPGIYDVTLIASTNYAADTLTFSSYITIFTPQPPVITQSNDTLTSSAASSYQWYMNSVVIPGATDQLLIITQSGDYSVVTVDFSGCITSDTINAILLMPQSSFTSAEVAGCPGSCFDFFSASLNAISYEWFFPGGDPFTTTVENPVNICYTNPGIYDVTLIASTNYASDTLTIPGYITIYTPLVISISQNGNWLTCNPAATSYQWSFNGNAIAGADSQSLYIADTGLYSVSIIDSNGCSATAFYDVAFVPGPGFYSPVPAVCEKYCTDFIDSSSNNPFAWQWFFPGGDPASSTDQNPSFICYNTSGIYSVTLITTNIYGNDTLIIPDYILVYSTPPIPVISQFGTTLISSPATAYQWQFNAVDIPGATNQSYTVTQSGLYTVIIYDQHGCINSATVKIVLTSVENEFVDFDVMVFPNPSNGNFIIEIVNASQKETAIEIFNTLGQRVFFSEEKISSASWKKEVNMQGIAAGIYLIEMKVDKGTIRKKMMIE